MERGFVEADPGYLYGYGLFETINVSEGKMFFYKEHMERLIKSTRKIGLTFKEDPFKIQKDCQRLIRANRMKTGALRVTFSKGKRRNNLLITARENPYGDNKYSEGVKITFSDYRRNENSLLVSLKSDNYLENLLVLNKAQKAGFNEAIFLNNAGNLAEGCVSNLFFIKDGVVRTPAKDCGLLPGIMRHKVLEILKEDRIEFEEGYYSPEQLFEADEIFITNSLMEVMPVKAINERDLYVGLVSKTYRIRTLFNRKWKLEEQDE